MANYLFRRSGGRYSYRRRYPVDVAAILKRAEFVQALGTADRQEAITLSHKVSVEFDAACARALSEPITGPATPSAAEIDTRPPPSRDGGPESVVASLPGILRQLTLDIVAEQGANPKGWMEGLSSRKAGLAAHIRGEMPLGIQMHPAVAQGALRAIQRMESEGIDLSLFDHKPIAGRELSTPPPAQSAAQYRLSKIDFETAFAEYARGKGRKRVQVARLCAERCLTLPCTRQEAVSGITAWCAQALTKGTKPSSVWTVASAVEALLKFVPGWGDFNVPKHGDLHALRGAGKASKDARASMSVPVLRTVLLDVDRHLPRNGQHWKATLVLCALYGLRPGELLGADIKSLVEVEDVMGATQLAFRVGISGAKNEYSKRDLPVPPHLEPIFRTALRLPMCSPSTVATRVQALNKILGNTLAGRHGRLTLYCIRHTFADVARGCEYTDAQFGPLMGHKGTSGITGVYGGKSPLAFAAGLLAKVEKQMFPEGLENYYQIA